MSWACLPVCRLSLCLSVYLCVCRPACVSMLLMLSSVAGVMVLVVVGAGSAGVGVSIDIVCVDAGVDFGVGNGIFGVVMVLVLVPLLELESELMVAVVVQEQLCRFSSSAVSVPNPASHVITTPPPP